MPDKDVWAYGETLRELAIDKGFKNISFSRLRDLVNIELPNEFNEMTYVANASNFRRALLNSFSRPDWSWEDARQSEDVCMTYRGYIKFLQLDLENVYPLKEDRTKSKYKKGIEYIARQMMARGDVSSAVLLYLTGLIFLFRHLPMQSEQSTLTTSAYPSIHPRAQLNCLSTSYRPIHTTQRRGTRPLSSDSMVLPPPARELSLKKTTSLSWSTRTTAQVTSARSPISIPGLKRRVASLASPSTQPD